MAYKLENTLTLSDAQRLNAPLNFNLMAKPVGSLCNLGCAYCYYLDKADIYGGREPRMSLEMLERFVHTYIDACQSREVVFNWHGGEPLTAGIDFYRKAVEFQRTAAAKYEGRKVVSNTIQTNATLITPEWAEFLRENNFLVGVSIDGPAKLHNRYRLDKAGGPTFEKVLRGIGILREKGVEYNLMCTVNHANERYGAEVYAFLKTLGTPYIQFMPVLEHISLGRIVPPQNRESRIAPWSVSEAGYGKFLCDVFDQWIRGDVGKVFVNVFEATLAQLCHRPPCNCTFAQTCGGNAIVEHNGDVYCCDHFVYPDWKIGNIFENTPEQMMRSEIQIRFGLDKRNHLPRKCLNCKYLILCNGECPKHRFSSTDSGEYGLNALCQGLYGYFEHTVPYFERLRKILSI